VEAAPIITLERLGSETLPKKSCATVKVGGGKKAKRSATIDCGTVMKREQVTLEAGWVGML
jgi:hypothetical protein